MISGLSWGIASVIVVLTLVVVFVIRHYLTAARSEKITNQRQRLPRFLCPPAQRPASPYTNRRSGGIDLDDVDTDVDIEDVVETTSRSLLASELMDTPSRSAPVDNFEPVRTESNYSGGSYDSGGGSSYDSGGSSFD